MISGWRKRYSDILKEFKYSEKKDKESAVFLNLILKKSNVNEKIINLVWILEIGLENFQIQRNQREK